MRKRAESTAGGTLGETRDQLAVARGKLRATGAEEHVDLGDGQRAEANDGAAAADGGEEFVGIFGEQDEVDSGWRLLQDLKERVGSLFHEGGGGEEEDPARGL